jgi:hypothetical protein
MTRKTVKNVKSGTMAPDDLRAGSFVTIHSSRVEPRRAWSEFEPMATFEHVYPPIMPEMGAVLQVLAVNLPYVLATVVKPGNARSELTLVDVRRVNLIHVNKAFVKAIVGFSPPHDDAKTSDAKPSDARSSNARSSNARSAATAAQSIPSIR